MYHILSPSHRNLLDAISVSNVLVGLDFDGTLAPIVDDPIRAQMAPSTRRLLTELALRYPCAVVSGRTRADLLPRLTGTGVNFVVGNHGLEQDPAVKGSVDRTSAEVRSGKPVPSGSPDPDAHANIHINALVRGWLTVLEKSLSDLDGVAIEDKGVSLSIHYRHAQDKQAARAVIRKAVARLDLMRVIGGKMVFNLVPLTAPNKGQAIERILCSVGSESAVYVGDDETDEDVFALQSIEPLLTVRVGQKTDSRACYFLQDQTEVDVFLRELIDRRADVRPNGARPGKTDLATGSVQVRHYVGRDVGEDQQ